MEHIPVNNTKKPPNKKKKIYNPESTERTEDL